jgi:hypothetical protein
MTALDEPSNSRVKDLEKRLARALAACHWDLKQVPRELIAEISAERRAEFAREFAKLLPKALENLLVIALTPRDGTQR